MVLEPPKPAKASAPDSTGQAGLWPRATAWAQRPIERRDWWTDSDAVPPEEADTVSDALVEAVAAAQTGVTITRAIATLAAIFDTIEPRPYEWSILFDATLPRGSAIFDSAARYRTALIELGSTGTREVLHAAGNTDALDASLLTDIWLSTVTTVVQWWLDHPGQDAAATTQRCVRLLRTLAGSAGSTQRPRT